MIEEMIMKGESVSCMFETLKAKMCDEYCKFPDKYSVKDNDANYDKLINEMCESCPLNVL